MKSALGGASPCFIVNAISESLAFYCGQLGFEKRFQAPDEDPFFAIVGRDAAQIFLKSESGIASQPNSTRHPHLRLDAFIYVEDPDVLAVEFTDRGVAFSAPLSDTHDGLRGFELRDPDGFVLFFGRPQ